MRKKAPKIEGIDRYFGGKGSSGTYQKIINCIRPHEVYIEGFLGAGSVCRNMRTRAATVIGVDMDHGVIEKWKAMQFDWIEVLKLDAFWLIKNLPLASYGRERIVLYLDPPYPISSRKSKVEVYNHELTDEQHVELLQLVKKLPPNIDVLISTYPNELYERELQGWKRIAFQSKTSRGVATEHLYMNYQEITELQDYTYVGTNYRERDRIKKKVRRWQQKFNELPLHERQAVYKALSADKELCEAALTANHGGGGR